MTITKQNISAKIFKQNYYFFSKNYVQALLYFFVYSEVIRENYYKMIFFAEILSVCLIYVRNTEKTLKSEKKNFKNEQVGHSFSWETILIKSTETTEAYAHDYFL